jgi:hypothetical protein
MTPMIAYVVDIIATTPVTPRPPHCSFKLSRSRLTRSMDVGFSPRTLNTEDSAVTGSVPSSTLLRETLTVAQADAANTSERVANSLVLLIVRPFDLFDSRVLGTAAQRGCN